MTLSATYDSVLARVRLAGSGLTVSDTFTRTVVNAWGTSDSGHVWSTDGGSASNYSTTGSRGIHSATARGTGYITYTGSEMLDVDIVSRVVVGVLATGDYISAGLVARFVSSTGDYYLLRAEFRTDQSIVLTLFRRSSGGFVTLASATSGATHSTGAGYSVRLQVVGSSLKSKFWQTSLGEPSSWDIDFVDSSPVTTSGGIGCRSFVSSSNTNTLPVAVEYDDFSAVPWVKVERSTNQVTWTTVRGGAALVPVSGAIALDDYEFAPDVTNYYRAVGQTANITPTLGGVWLKSLARPFLNRQVTVVDYSDVARTSRAGVFDIVGRSFPIAVTDLHGSRRWTLDVLASTLAEAEDLDLLISTGEVQFVHVPAGSGVPGGYVALGDTSERRPGRRSVRRVFSLPFTAVAAPGPDIIPAVGTWQTVVNNYTDWSALTSDKADWNAVLQLVGSIADVIVP